MPAQAREWQTKRDCSSLVEQAIPPFTPEKRQQILLQCEIAEEFKAFVGERQSCTQDADCVPYCVFRTDVGTDSGNTWATVPAGLGHRSGALGQPFRATWALIPEHLGTRSSPGA